MNSNQKLANLCPLYINMDYGRSAAPMIIDMLTLPVALASQPTQTNVTFPSSNRERDARNLERLLRNSYFVSLV